MQNGKPLPVLCRELNIELAGDEGQPYHCDERMNVRSGILGPDFAECGKCGVAIGNMLSPHINGGCIFDEGAYKDKEVWVCLVKRGNE